MIQVYKKSSKNAKTGVVYWRLWWRVSGTIQSEGVGAISKRDAETLRAQKQAQLAADPTLGQPAGTKLVTDWFEQHIRDKGARMQDSSAAVLRATKKYLVDWLTARYGHAPTMEEVSKRDALDFYNHLFTVKTRFGELMAQNTCNKHARNCIAVFGSALEHKTDTGVRENPFVQSNIQGNVIETAKKFQEVSDEAFAKILDACPDTATRSLFAICFYGGTRSGEARRLKWAQVHWDAPARITILLKKRADGRPGVRTTKERERVIPMEPELHRILLEAFEASGHETAGPCDGLPGDSSTLSLIATRVIRRAGIPRYGNPLHALRAGRENRWLSNPNLTDEVVHQWVGHSQNVSRKHYSKATLGAMAKVAVTDVEAEIRRHEEAIARLKGSSGPKQAQNAENPPSAL